METTGDPHFLGRLNGLCGVVDRRAAPSAGLTAMLPEAVRLLVFKSGRSVLVHDDGGGNKPLSCIGGSSARE